MSRAGHRQSLRIPCPEAAIGLSSREKSLKITDLRTDLVFVPFHQPHLWASGLEIVRTVREAVGPEIEPQADVNGSWTPVLYGYVAERKLGRILSGDPGFILRRNPDRVRAPDVCFYDRGRLPDGRLP